MSKTLAIAPAFLSLLFAAGAAWAWQPTGSLAELCDDALLPRARTGVKMASFSSYDRTGGNNDGFSGQYSKLREEDGNSVIAEMEGPGCIYRLWTTHAGGEADGLLERKGEHIRIYLDGEAVPALDAPMESLFDNSLERFPNPLAGKGIGGFYSYIPIPYRKSCKVVVDGLGVKFYQLNYATFPSDEGVKTFQMAMTPEERELLGRAVARWKDPLGTLRAAGEAVEIPLAHQPAGKEPAPFTHTLTVDAPTLLHGMTLEGVDPAFVARTEIEITATGASLRLPLAFFFGQVPGAVPYSSLLFGAEGGVWYNRVPFVCARECVIRLSGILPAEGKLTVFRSPLAGDPADCGTLMAQYNESLPTRPGVHHPLLKTAGRGHVVGTLLSTEGPEGLPFWLEGDDRWVVDGELRIHGTGSEDYFNCGWYALKGRLNGPEALPSHGFPVYGIAGGTMRAAAFRWHYGDPVPFAGSMDFAIEHGEVNRHIADYRSAVFWYACR
ncbi:MAG TPA: DUF2961 domain-containing protein [Candidatus Hydrogenedentes bacterium]|nr:DUF2961 domain-containing protein [Candidatus Hydrogenedentota bacterium]